MYLFKPRMIRPESGNPYYNTPAKGGYAVGAILGKPTDAGCNVLSNCVGYSASRFNECLGAHKWLYLLYPPDPDKWMQRAISEGLSTGFEPKLGAVLVWDRHVANVEKVNDDGTIVTSESGWGCQNPFWTTTRNNSDGCWNGKSFGQFHGFIYLPEKEGNDMSEHKQGIDISYCQTKVDWDKVTADFVIIKAGQRDFTDPMFESHYKGAKSRGIPVGAYWYLDALTVEDAKKEADCFIQRLKGKQFEYPVYLDIENKAQFNLGKEKVSAMIRAFLERVESAGYWVGLYGSYSSLITYTAEDIRKRYSIWLAHWDVQKSPYSGAYGVWQYSVGKADGITGACDLDYSYEDYPAKIKAKGLNGYGKPPEPTPTPTPTPTPQKKTIRVEIADNGTTYAGTLSEI